MGNFQTMHIYIDESGQFIPLNDAKSRAAAVVALVVPDSQRMALVREFKKTRKQLRPGATEIKGSSLSEQEAARILALLATYDLLLEAVVVDVGQHKDDDVTRFKMQRADNLLESIDREHKATLIHDLLETQQRLIGLSNQLFIQASCMFQLIPRVVETATMYYSQRLPRELGQFHWRIDAKADRATAMEQLWSLLVPVAVATRSLSQPMVMYDGGDYSSYERFDVPADPPTPGQFRTDLKRVLREDLRFLDSNHDIGLQIADIVAAVLTRALNGTLEESGWRGLGKLFILRTEKTLRVIALSRDALRGMSEPISKGTWTTVIRTLECDAKGMFVPGARKALKRVISAGWSVYLIQRAATRTIERYSKTP
jgi:hypothetical protein